MNFVKCHKIKQMILLNMPRLESHTCRDIGIGRSADTALRHLWL